MVEGAEESFSPENSRMMMIYWRSAAQNDPPGQVEKKFLSHLRVHFFHGPSFQREEIKMTSGIKNMCLQSSAFFCLSLSLSLAR